MVSIFIYVLGSVFQVTFDAYQFNRKIAAKMYAKTNIDGLFEIMERELKYSGSQNNVMNALLQSKGVSFEARPLHVENSGNHATITTKYALAEKIILTKEFKDDYASITEINDNGWDYELTYFPLFDADFPEIPTEGLFSLQYNALGEDASSASILTMTGYSSVSTDYGYAYQIDSTPSPPATYVSPLIYDRDLQTENESTKININGNMWNGEIIYQTTIRKTPDSSTIEMNRYIPTIDTSYTVDILDSVSVFDATRIENSNIYVATVVYKIPDFDSTITKSRTFNDWRK